jgi:DNA modification methylase
MTKVPGISPDTTDSGYRTITLALRRPLNPTEIGIIHTLENRLRNDGFFFTVNDHTVVFHYHTLDLDTFRKTIFSLLEKFSDARQSPDVDSTLFTDLLARIDDVRSYGIRDGKRVYVGYDRERKVKDRKEKVVKRCSYYYARAHQFTSEVNPVPAEFLDTIICGDSAEVLKKIPSNSVDLIFTSPPYNFGLDYDTGEDGVFWDTYFEKLFAVFTECIRVLKYGGRVLVNVQPLFSDYIPIHHIISHFFMQNNLIWKGEILWEKNNYNCKYTAWGSWKSPSNPYLKYTWEYVEIFCKGDLKKCGNRDDIDISAEEFKKWVVARWSIGPERAMKEFGHPAMFPEELVERALKLFSYRNDIILDPFNGVGTTAVVAKKLNRRYIGIDVSPEYCKKTEGRLKKTPVQKKLDVT